MLPVDGLSNATHTCLQEPPAPTVARAAQSFPQQPLQQQPLQLPQPSQAGYQQVFDLAQVGSTAMPMNNLLLFPNTQGGAFLHENHRLATPRQQAAQCRTCCSQAQHLPTRARARPAGSSDCSSRAWHLAPRFPHRQPGPHRRGRPPTGPPCRTLAFAARAPPRHQRPRCHQPSRCLPAVRGRSAYARLTCRATHGNRTSGATQTAATADRPLPPHHSQDHPRKPRRHLRRQRRCR